MNYEEVLHFVTSVIFTERFSIALEVVAFLLVTTDLYGAKRLESLQQNIATRLTMAQEAVSRSKKWRASFFVDNDNQGRSEMLSILSRVIPSFGLGYYLVIRSSSLVISQ